jgi:ATP-dependent Lon protease
MPQYIEKAEKMSLPLLALRDTVAFPAGLLNFELTDEVDVLAAKSASATGGLMVLVAEVPEGVDDLAPAEPLDEEVVDSDLPEHLLSDILQNIGITDADASEEEPKPPLYSVGTVVRLKQMVKTPEKQVRIIVEGVSRATLLSVNEEGPFPTADLIAKVIALGDVNDLQARAYRHTLLETLKDLSKLLPAGVEDMMNVATLKIRVAFWVEKPRY